MRNLLKQPLLVFLLIGSLLFFIDSRRSVKRNDIYVSTAMQDRLAALWQSQTGLTASPDELDSLIQNWIDEEVLYQEALRLGLDEEDSIIRRRLVQKLNFIAESEPIPEPELATLEAFYNANLDAYTLPTRYSFRQLYFATEAAAVVALDKIAADVDPASVGETSMLSANYAYRSALDLNASFGAGFAAQLQDVEIAKWQGPFVSGFGYHLIFVSNVHASEVTPFAALSEQLRVDFGQYQRENAQRVYRENLLDAYNIVVEPR